MAATAHLSRDPFADDKAHPQQPHRSSPRPPPPPPKSASKQPKMPAPAPDNHRDISEAVRETVTLQGQSERAKMARSQTHQPPPAARPSPAAGRRSHSQDNSAAADKDKSKSAKHRPKKGSQHADVIDRLDFTGVGPMFHHDGPFDACAPSRNKHSNKAPMAAWTPRELGAPASDLRNMDSPYPSAKGAHTFSYEYEQPKKKVDAIAEAWGIHEPEPFEEFSAGGGGGKGDTPTSSIYNGRSSRRDRSDDSQPRPRHNKRAVVPPPKPIFVPDAAADVNDDWTAPSPPATSPGASGPKRSKSLMQRIRKMRDAPNVPTVNPLPEEVSPSSSTESAPRSSYRHQTGRNGDARGADSTSPNPEGSDAFVYIDDPKRRGDKDLPITPGTSGAEYADYFDSPSSPGGGLGRRTSLMKKVRGVVRGGK